MYNKFKKIINNSVRYDFEIGGILTLTSYYTGKEIKLDLSKITEEMLETLIVDEENDEDF